MRVYPGETSITLPGGTVLNINPSPAEVPPTEKLYYELQVKALESDCQLLVNAIGSCIKGGESDRAPLAAALQDQLKAVEAAWNSIMSLLIESAAVWSASAAPTVSPTASLSELLTSSRAADAAARRTIYESLRLIRQSGVAVSVKAEAPATLAERMDSLKAVLTLCNSGITAARLGHALSTEIGKDTKPVHESLL
jgi:hypothetical protein